MAKQSTEKQIKDLTLMVSKLLAREVAPVLPVLPVAPIAPVLPLAPANPDDHNILTAFRAESIVEFRNINETLKKIQENAIGYVTQGEHNEVVKIQVDHETRIRVVETAVTKVMQWGTIAIILLGIIEFAINKFF